jgi:hypothetical protein
MPTVCELKVQLKAKGIKGTSGLNKAKLQEMLDKAPDLGQKRKATNAAKAAAAPAAAKLPKMTKSTPAAAKLPKMAKATSKQAIAPLMLKYKEEEGGEMTEKKFKREFYNDHKTRIDTFKDFSIENLTNKRAKALNLVKRGGTEQERMAASRQFMIAEIAIEIKVKEFIP